MLKYKKSEYNNLNTNMLNNKNKRLRVLYLLTFPFYGSGSGTYARYLAKYVNKKLPIAILSPDNRQLDNVKTYQLKLPLKVAFTGHPEWKNCKLFKEITNFELLKIYKAYLNETVRVVEEFKPNIIHVHHAYPFSWAARFIKSTYQIPYIISIHGSELPTAQKDKRYLALTMDALRKARKIIPNSYWTKEWALKIFGEEYRKRVKVIPGGVDVQKFKKIKTDDFDKKYQLKGKKIVVFSGKLTVYKGVKYLIKAAKKIKAEILIAGHGPERKNLEEIVKNNKITNVKFLGHFSNNTNELIKLYSRADVFVAPSIWDEPLGLVILEAMACQTPVVVTRKGGIPLMVKNGKNGLFIRPRNTTDIVEKINYLLSNEAIRKKMGQKAREIAEKKFSWQIIAEKFIDIYKKIAI